MAAAQLRQKKYADRSRRDATFAAGDEVLQLLAVVGDWQLVGHKEMLRVLVVKGTTTKGQDGCQDNSHYMCCGLCCGCL